MKNLNTQLVVLLAGISLVMGVGCSSSSTTSNSAVTTTDPGSTTPATTTSTTTAATTNTVTFVPVSLQELNSYIATHPLNNPSNIALTVDLADVGSNTGRLGGTIHISYTDNGNNYSGTFTSGAGRNVSMSDLKDNGVYEAEFNRWFMSGGKTVFTGFFQDNYGSIVLVVNDSVSQGDGQGTGNLSGAIYYKNFAQSYTQQSPYRKCWFIYSGPFSCRDSGIINKNSLTPTDGGYRLLGTFSGLNKSLAFK